MPLDTLNPSSPWSLATAWDRPVSRAAWLAEYETLSQRTTPYHPDPYGRNMLWVGVISCLLLMLLFVRTTFWVTADLCLLAGAVFFGALLVRRGMRGLAYATDVDRMRITQLQPTGKVPDEEDEAQGHPEALAALEALNATDVPILQGDIQALRVALRRDPGYVPRMPDATGTALTLILGPFLIFVLAVLFLGAAHVIR